ncbi:hypothetical protein BU16DRAFT_563991 [Lophium mytilinum]|uniref:Uncharacterized protein n=1 Tax=Lophium mytilinum TaxID=390894 RepID=A0A6A6QL12_9PEZI|nr:hypothetical protein BU16DRAFT_563991 [Lophium mytilinum]
MAYAIGPGWIILICMLAAGFCVCVGYAIARFALSREEEEPQRSPEQDRYMREVRARRLMYLEEICYGPKGKRVYGHGPQVMSGRVVTLPIVPENRRVSDLGSKTTSRDDATSHMRTAYPQAPVTAHISTTLVLSSTAATLLKFPASFSRCGFTAFGKIYAAITGVANFRGMAKGYTVLQDGKRWPHSPNNRPSNVPLSSSNVGFAVHHSTNTFISTWDSDSNSPLSNPIHLRVTCGQWWSECRPRYEGVDR